MAVQAASAAAATGGVLDTLPSEVRLSFVTLTTLNWSNRQAVGTIVGQTRLSPGLNPYTAHLSEMWTAWSGSMELRISISGSGMYGGSLMCAMIPPGIDIGSVNNPGAFPHVIIDARITDPVCVLLPDVRNVEYHYMNGSDPTPSLGLWVYNRLINPFGGGEVISQVQITIDTRPGPDFQFAMLRPPNTSVDGGLSPATLLPRRLGRARGNRMGGRVTGLKIVQVSTQVNHHWDVRRSTYGWSRGPPGPVVANMDLGSASGTNIHIGADGRGPILPNIPNNFPDFCASSLASTGTDSTQWRAPVGPATFFDNNWDVVETTAYLAIIAVTDNQNALLDHIQADSMVVYPRTRTGTDVSGQNILIQPQWLHGSSNITIDPVPMYGVTASVGPRGGNNIVLWREEMMTDHPGQGFLYCTQLEYTSTALEESEYHIPESQMAVFQVEDDGSIFQVGLTSTGHLYTNAAPGTEVTLSPNTTFTFVGLFPLTYALMGPAARGAFSAAQQ